MNKDIAKGKLKQVEGKAQDALGNMSGDTDEQIKGKLKQAEGKIQEGYGRAKESVNNALDNTLNQHKKRHVK